MHLYQMKKAILSNLVFFLSQCLLFLSEEELLSRFMNRRNRWPPFCWGGNIQGSESRLTRASMEQNQTIRTLKSGDYPCNCGKRTSQGVFLLITEELDEIKKDVILFGGRIPGP